MRVNKTTTYDLVRNLISIDSIWSKHSTQAHIAMIIKRGKIINIATNNVGSRSKGCGFETRTIHAERAVLKKMGDNTKLAGAIMIVIRIAKGTRQIVNSEPCHSCKCHLEKCMKEHGLRYVYYST